MKKLATILSFILWATLPLWSLNMSIEHSIHFFEKNKKGFELIAHQYGCNVYEIAAIALPEVERYAEWQNYLENMALWQYYIKGGTEEADFSIGYFQMKPSFIEKLECEIVENECWIEKFGHVLPQGDLSLSEARKYRLEKLNDLFNQFDYLCIYYQIMQEKYSNIIQEENKIRFFAAAYNYGFDREENAIKKWMPIKAFPYGRKFNFEQDAYADVSLSIYRILLENKVNGIIC